MPVGWQRFVIAIGGFPRCDWKLLISEISKVCTPVFGSMRTILRGLLFF
jgi:hypothetical protein